MTRHLTIILFTVILFCLDLIQIYGQPDQSLTGAKATISSETGDALPREMVFLHHDKPFYLSGEKIWFRAYVQNQKHPGKPVLSSVIYADMINSAGEIITSACLRLNQNMASGNFYLADSLPTGRYRLRAYSNWMKNFDPEYFHNEDIIIINRFEEAGNLFHSSKADSTLACRFYYEKIPGNDSSLHVVFRLTDINTRGIDAAGWIEDAAGIPLKQVKTTHAGIGSFDLAIDALKQSFIVFQTGNYRQRFIIHEYEPHLYSIGIRKMGTRLLVNIQYHGLDQNLMNEGIILGVYAGGSVPIIQERALSEGLLKFTLDSLPGGILRFFVMNKSGQIYAERFYAAREVTFPAISYQANKPVYGNREKVKLQLSMNKLNNKQTLSNVSVSVSDVPEMIPSLYANHNIYSVLFKEAGIFGQIKDPLWYFRPGNDSGLVALNDLLLTASNHVAEWKQLSGIQDKYLSNCAEITGIHMTGQLIQKNDGEPVQGIRILLASPDSIPVVKSAVTDHDGRFSFICDGYYGNKDIVLQTDETSNSDRFTIRLHSNLAATTIDQRKFLPSFDSVTMAEIEKDLLRLKIDKTYDINESVMATAHNQAAWFKAYGIPDKVVYPGDFIKLNGLPEIVTEILPGVWLRKKEGQYTFQAFDESRGKYTPRTTLMVDGVPVKDPSGMLNWDSDKFWKIDISYSPRIFGDWMMGSVVSVFTRTLNCPLQLENVIIRMKWQGYQEPENYQPPTYEKADEYSNPRPDFRSLLYWNPSLQLSSDSTSEIEFYTSDNSGTYYVQIQGITGDGDPVSLCFPISVGEADNINNGKVDK